MPRSPTRRLSLGRALTLSSGLHLLGAFLFSFVVLAPFVAARHAPETLRVRSERLSPGMVVTFEKRPRRTVPARLVVHAALPAAVTSPARRPQLRRTSPTSEDKRPVPTEKSRTIAAAGDASKTFAQPAPQGKSSSSLTPSETAPDAAAQAPSLASPSPEPAPATPAVAAPLAATHGGDVPIGGWGQFAKPLVADETALGELRAKYHVAASVLVDEAGHAIRVIFNRAPSADARTEIEQRLLALHYLPAECNGVRCSGTLLIEF